MGGGKPQEGNEIYTEHRQHLLKSLNFLMVSDRESTACKRSQNETLNSMVHAPFPNHGLCKPTKVVLNYVSVKLTRGKDCRFHPILCRVHDTFGSRSRFWFPGAKKVLYHEILPHNYYWKWSALSYPGPSLRGIPRVNGKNTNYYGTSLKGTSIFFINHLKVVRTMMEADIFCACSMPAITLNFEMNILL